MYIKSFAFRYVYLPPDWCQSFELACFLVKIAIHGRNQQKLVGKHQKEINVSKRGSSVYKDELLKDWWVGCRRIPETPCALAPLRHRAPFSLYPKCQWSEVAFNLSSKFFVMERTRSKWKCPLFGDASEINSNMLPTYENVMKFYEWNRHKIKREKEYKKNPLIKK